VVAAAGRHLSPGLKADGSIVAGEDNERGRPAVSQGNSRLVADAAGRAPATSG